MERLRLKFDDAARALGTLKEILGEPHSVVVRDASIQRFEYTFEALWKFIQEYLKEREGLLANSPKACFRELFSLGVLNEEETVSCLDMTDSRNETAHTYKEKVAEAIYGRLAAYIDLMDKVLTRLFQNMK